MFKDNILIWLILFQLLNLHLWQAAHCKLQTTHCTCTCKFTCICTCTLHTTHWTLYTACHTFLLNAAHLSLLTENIKICLSGIQDLHGQMNINLCKVILFWRAANNTELYNVTSIFLLLLIAKVVVEM